MASIDVGRWLQSNANDIKQALAKQVPHVYSRRPNNLCLSDLRLCHAVSSMPTPPGFSHKIGTIFEHGDYSPVYHEAHVSNDGNMVVEYVPGQFFANEDRNKSGKPQLLAVASHLVHVLSNEVFVAAGYKSELERLFDIIYAL